MQPPLYDTHAHLDFKDFAQDLNEVLARAREAGVGRIVTIGTDLESSRRAMEIAAAHDGVSAAVGWHPGHVLEAPADIRKDLLRLARDPVVCAIGETGLDFHRLPSSQGGQVAEDEPYRARQIRLFEQHLEVAAETGLNCVVHTRDSMPATLEVFRPFAGRVRAVFHCFVGTCAEMNEILELGSLVSFTGIVTFKNAAQVAEVARVVPPDRFMVETDAPFLAPMPFRGKRCEPGFVSRTAGRIAELKGVSLEEVARQTTETADAFFRFHPR